jgi:putative phosphoesterase
VPLVTLYDIHGNLPALEAVLREVPDDATIVVGGDVCMGGPQPAETLERLRRLGDPVRWVRGNADRELTPSEEGLVPPEIAEKTRAALSSEQIEFLHELPPTVRIDDVLFCHATPRNDVDIFTERTPEAQVAHLFADTNATVVVCGHTHMQFERSIAGKRVINSGSVGLPFEDAPGAYWTLDLAHRRTGYEGAEIPAAGREETIERFERAAVGSERSSG